tara:strand:+ start:162 stop:398 length:237 start_codon:yes stop_codon:yes gene_type:complete
MNTLVKPQIELKTLSFNNLNRDSKVQLNNPKVTSDYKFYQKLFLVFLGMSIFLIFPESPGDSEKLCKKYNSAEVCNIW